MENFHTGKIKSRWSPDFPCVYVNLNRKDGIYNMNDSQQESNNELDIRTSNKSKNIKKSNELSIKKMTFTNIIYL